LPNLRLIRSAESWIGVSGFLISCAMRRATSPQAAMRCAADEVGHVVEGDHVALELPPVLRRVAMRTSRLSCLPRRVSLISS
jgi:hypothetical protein